MMGATPMPVQETAQQPVQPVTQNQEQFMNGGVQMPTGYGTVLKSPSQVMMGAGVPTMEENVAGMMSSTPSTAPTLPGGVQPGSPQANFLSMQASGQPLTPGQISQAQEFAGSMGTTFDPETGYSREPFLQAQEQQAQAEAQRQTGLAGPLPGQSLSQFMRYEDQPSQRTEQFVDPQGRLRMQRSGVSGISDLVQRSPLPSPNVLDSRDFPVTPPVDSRDVRNLPATPADMGMMTDFFNRTQVPPLSSFEQASQDRIDRMEAKPNFMEAQPGSSGAGGDGTFTKSELNRIAKGQARDATPREKAKAMEILQRSGQYDPITGKREPTEAEKTKEQLEIDYIQGRIDNLAPTATEKQKDQLEVDLLEAQIKKAKESLEPEDIEVVVKGGWSYITKNGQYQIGRFIDLEDKTPAGIREADEKVQRIKNARDLYQKGDKTGAQDILASLDIKDMAGLPAQADDYFGTVTDYGFGDKGNADIQKALGANPGVSVGDIIKEMISKGKL